MSKLTNIPVNLISLYNNRRVLAPRHVVPSAPHILNLKLPGLRGGKGGFGANLKSSGKSGGKGTTNFSACRDLSGRRLRHVENEKALKKWYQDQQNGASSEGSNQKTHWYKSTICKDWLKARENRDAPSGASLHWGCPRGRNCTFAHGVTDMGSKEAQDTYRKKEAEKRRMEKDHKLRAYASSAALTNYDADDAVTQGLMLHRKRRRVCEEKEEEEEVDKKGEDGILKGNGNFATVRLGHIELRRGVWYYEVTLLTEGLMQIGWAQTGFSSNSESGDGVGDDDQSWSYDGYRQCVWHAGKETSYGKSVWRTGDIVGCILRIEGRFASIEFTLNGVSQGIAFQDLDMSRFGMFPVMSMNGDQAVRVNVGRVPFAYVKTDEKGVVFANVSDSKLIVLPEKEIVVLHEKKKIVSKDEEEKEEPKKEKKKTFDAIDLSIIKSLDMLKQSFSADHSKNELSRRGLKCGGTPEDRANRLWSVKGMSQEEAKRFAGVQNKKKRKRRKRK